MFKPLEKEFKHYIENQNKLVKRYNNKYVVIKNKKVIGVYDSEVEAVRETSKNEPLGTFLVQKCTPGKKDYTVTLHSNSKEGLKKVLYKMDGVIKKGEEAEWLNMPNKELNDNTPFEVISRGPEGIKQVLEILHGIEYGISI